MTEHFPADVLKKSSAVSDENSCDTKK